ncbi:MAG: MBOAT family O-acyltransferase [Anaerolineaceae bacterium]|nr:MBOAT family O-acyltransferase [Anaerolineaceae bacterium]
MTLSSILVFAAAALLFRLVARERFRGWLLLISSALAIYWLQPLSPVRNLDFWLPTLTLALAVLSWWISASLETRKARQNAVTAAVLAGLVLAIGLTRFLGLEPFITASLPPQIGQIALALAVLVLLGLLLTRFTKVKGAFLLNFSIFALIGLFVVLKLPALTTAAAAGLRALMGQSTDLAKASDLSWLGFSYVAFRLIHTLRDRQNGRLPAVSLQEYLVYAIFFPSFTAGPIDRLDRFIKDLRKPLTPLASASDDFSAAGTRLALGLFKKFVLADSLALIALNAANAGQVRSAGWMWLLVYAYALQIFFDFSGYTDIAIGLGRVLGIRLPENFNAPYLKPNLTQFWNNWHMTLTQWFRAYFFNPLTRALRSAKKPLSQPLMILITQVSTFVLIGLWHGITLNFVFWGLWHGLGLFAQNRWSDWIKPRAAVLEGRPLLKRTATVLGTLLTFHYVALGWVWFALPSPQLSWQVLERLFGL